MQTEFFRRYSSENVISLFLFSGISNRCVIHGIIIIITRNMNVNWGKFPWLERVLWFLSSWRIAKGSDFLGHRFLLKSSTRGLHDRSCNPVPSLPNQTRDGRDRMGRVRESRSLSSDQGRPPTPLFVPLLPNSGFFALQLRAAYVRRAVTFKGLNLPYAVCRSVSLTRIDRIRWYSFARWAFFASIVSSVLPTVPAIRDSSCELQNCACPVSLCVCCCTASHANVCRVWAVK